MRIPEPSPNPRSIRGRVCPLAPAAAPHSSALREGPGLGLSPQTPLFECASVYPDKESCCLLALTLGRQGVSEMLRTCC